MVCHDLNCRNIYINCSNVCEVGYLPREAGTIGHKFSFKKTELILRPVFALISQALQSTEIYCHSNVYCFVCLLTFRK